jgi:hypothetical protein
MGEAEFGRTRSNANEIWGSLQALNITVSWDDHRNQCFRRTCCIDRSRGSSVSIVTGFTAGVRSRQDKKIFPHSTVSWSPTQPPIQPVPEAISPGVKRPGCEADHSPRISAEVKNGELHLHSPICLYGIVLNELRAGKISPFYLYILLLSLPWR